MKIRLLSLLLMLGLLLFFVSGCGKDSTSEESLDPRVIHTLESYCDHIQSCGRQLASCPIATSSDRCQRAEMYQFANSQAMLKCQVDMGMYYQCLSRVPCDQLGQLFNTTMHGCAPFDEACVTKAFGKYSDCQKIYLDKKKCLESNGIAKN